MEGGRINGAVLVGKEQIHERMQANMSIFSTLTHFEVFFSLQVKITTKAGTGLDVKHVEEGEVRDGENILYIFFYLQEFRLLISPLPPAPLEVEKGAGETGAKKKEVKVLPKRRDDR